MNPIPKENEFLYSFPDITDKSVLIDVGCYEGQWSVEMNRRYGCLIHAFEPLQRFYDQCAKNIAENPRIHLYHAGVGGKQRFGEFHVHGSMTGEFDGGTEVERCHVIRIGEILDWCDGNCACLKLNAEGAEFEILETMVNTGLMLAVKNMVVQWHPVVPDCEERWYKLQRELAHTHELTYDTGWTWQKLSRKCLH